MSTITPKIIFLSVVYFITALVIITIVDIGLYFFLTHIVFRILNWFNDFNWILKLIFLFLGGATIFNLLLDWTSLLAQLLGGIIFNHLPLNWFTLISSMALSVINAVYNIIWLWKIPEHFTFWIICEMILLSGFIWSFCSIVMPLKEQMNSVYNKDY